MNRIINLEKENYSSIDDNDYVRLKEIIRVVKDSNKYEFKPDIEILSKLGLKEGEKMTDKQIKEWCILRDKKRNSQKLS
jgi:predicted glycosyltransferase